ncbi:hypothetical protein ANO14919_103960 [Xylariales sp. No.14919]|nr:hypothetical protein ANO14919_103960 [Xylariales sp. No.14919]
MDGNPNDVAQNRVDHGSLHENSGPSDELCTEILAAPHDEGSTPAQRISDGMQMNRPKETFAGSLSIVTYTQRDQPQEGAHSRTGSQELRTQQNIPEPASAIHSHEYDEFYKAIEQSNIHLIYQFLENDIDLEQANSTGSRPLHLAAGLGHLEVVELFLQAGADVESFDETSEVRSTVLQQAVYRNDMQIAEILLQHGADVNLVDSSGETVLLAAIKNHFPGMVELLLRYGANKEVTDQSGATAFALAQQSETMAFLLQQPQLLQGPIPVHLREPRERSSLIKRVRQVRGDNDKMITLQGFEATVVDFSIGEDSENRIERSISVYKLLYGSQEVIETPQTSQLKGKQRAFRRYHLPANNVSSARHRQCKKCDKY